MQVKAQRLPPHGVQVRISVVACTSSYIHWSALISECYAFACSTANMQYKNKKTLKMYQDVGIADQQKP